MGEDRRALLAAFLSPSIPSSLNHALQAYTPSYPKIREARHEPDCQVARLFIIGKSQAVRLPVAYRFDTKEVFIRRDQETGDVNLSRKPADWNDFLSAIQGAEVPADFLG